MKLSVITAHFDDPEGLCRTAHSLTDLLKDDSTQWLLVDGGTEALRNRTTAWAKEVAEAASLCISEPDTGIYNAMNKGTRVCSGDYVLYLNAGDELHPGFSLVRIERELNGSRPEMIWGTCFERFPNGELVKVKNRSPKLAWYGIPVNHQNVLFRKDVLGPAPYNERYRFCADYDLISRILQHGDVVHRTEVPVAIFLRGGTSARSFGQTMREEEVLRCEHYGLSPFASRAISIVKKLNHRAGSVPSLRRLLRKWV